MYGTLEVGLLFKIASVGILIIIIDKILKSSGKDDIAVITNIAGIVIILLMVVSLVSKLFAAAKALFQF